MGFDYITEGPPIQPVTISPAMLFDKVNNNLYVSNGLSTHWVIIGNTGGQNDSVQNVTTSGVISFLGANNTFIKAVAGSGGIFLTLPNSIGLAGQQITVIMVDTGAGGVTVQTDNTVEPQQTINGQYSYEFTNQYQAATLESDNGNWLVRSTAG